MPNEDSRSNILEDMSHDNVPQENGTMKYLPSPSSSETLNTSNDDSDNSAPVDPTKLPRVFIVAGPTATGKTTVGKAVAEKYGIPFVEGDDLHSEENVHKMATGHPLTDSDRWDWLRKICTTSLEQASTPSSPPESIAHLPAHPRAVVATCSSLKRSYRDYLRQQLPLKHLAVMHFLFLTGSEDVLVHRTEQRKNHYMKSDMVRSQLATLEVPHTTREDDDGQEVGVKVESGVKTREHREDDCKVVFTDELTPDQVVERTIEVVEELMVKDAKDSLPASFESYSDDSRSKM